MSTLTEEQRKRIEENRARALAKLAEKQKSHATALPKPVLTGYSSGNFAQQQTVNQVKSSSLVRPGSFYKNSYNGHSKEQTRVDGNMFAAFQYQKNKPTTSNNHRASSSYHASSNQNKTKTVNSALKQKITANCVLTSRNRFKVVVGFHSGLIGIFKTLSTGSYDAKTRTWSFHLEEHEKLMNQCKPLASEVVLSGIPNNILKLFLSKKEQPQDDVASEDINWDLIDEKIVGSLMPFQREGVIFSIKNNGRILLADDMGLGKTIQAISVACYYKTSWPLLIVVPSSLRMTWRRAFLRWAPSVKPDSINVVLSGKDKPNIGLINIISYDLLVKKISEVRDVGYKVIIADECHFIKNPKAERTKAILPLLKKSCRAILISGTPALSRPIELFTQISAVNPKLFQSYHHFGLRYCAAVQNNFGWDYSGSSNMEELQMVLEDSIMIRRLKKVVLDQLPSKTREVVLLDPSLIKEKSLSRTEEELSKATTESNKRSALLQYFTETCSVKTAAVKEYVIDLVDGGHKIIVFAHHQEMLDAISQALIKKKFSYIRIDGKTASVKRQHLCDQFQRDWETRVAVLSVTAANTGLTLTEATCVVFAELFWNPGALVQAEDRAYRIGQKNAVVIHYLLARKTADDHLWPLIQKKLDVLSEAGLNKEDFSMLEQKTFQDPKQRNLKDLFEALLEDDDEKFLAECNLLDVGETSGAKKPEKHAESSCTKREHCSVEALYAENASTSQESTSDNNNGSSKTNELCVGEEWFDDDGWDDDELDLVDSVCEPNAKRKCL